MANWEIAAQYGWPEAVITADQNQNCLEILRADRPWNEPSAMLWRWNSSTAPELTETEKKHFVNITDCKPVYGGRYVLTSASGGAVALVCVTTRLAEFVGYAGGNTHSAELLPDGNIVAASSTGNFITLFARVPGKREPLQSRQYPFADAHGCVWDKTRKLLWVGGARRIAAFEYDAATVELRQKFVCEPATAELGISPEIKLDNGNFMFHDLFPVPGEDSIFVSNVGNVVKFYPATRAFRPFFAQENVKSISRHPQSGEVIYQVPTTSWWTDTVSVMGGNTQRVLPEAKFYKARWFVANLFSYDD